MITDDFDWIRYTDGDTPVYLHKKAACWFVPNKSGDALLCRGAKTPADEEARFISRMPETASYVYTGRGNDLSLSGIKELWFHITNRCNAECLHCLFSSSPDTGDTLDADTVLNTAFEAYETGTRLFVLTGGEPLVHPEIKKIVTELLAYDGANVVMLTNGYLLERFLDDAKPDMNRFHIQMSLDGIGSTNDSIRGDGSFERMQSVFAGLKKKGVKFTISMCVTAANVKQMADMADFAADAGAGNLHYMWYFVRGRGEDTGFADTDSIFCGLQEAQKRADARGITIDNIESMKTQLFAPAGTVHDGGTAGWESLAVGPDGKLYPSAALVGVKELATDMESGIVQAWKTGPALNAIRKSSITGCTSPFRFIIGGGDIDHCYIYNKKFIGCDPYESLHEKTALWLIASETKNMTQRDKPEFLLRMGEILLSCGAHGKVALAHSNCLLATADNDSLTTIKDFYSSAVRDAKKDILNPVSYDNSLISHIPQKYRFRGYGCGSPVNDAGIHNGDTVVDLGCGSGVECFIAASLTGRDGRVIGVDMLDPMLNIANEAKPQVAKNLGYSNVDFRKGYLEDLPVETDSVDVAVSNCVMNLSVNKRRAYAEIFRMLRPGGRLVISDVVTETEPDPAIRNDDVLKGECIAGALTIRHLMALLEETGFTGISLVKRFFYREVRGHSFFSLTFSAEKPVTAAETVSVIYRGPTQEIVTDGGITLRKGETARLDRHAAEALGELVFILDEAGNVTNIQAENSCCCFIAPEQKDEHQHPEPKQDSHSGCMVCGAPLVYDSLSVERRCEYCGSTIMSNAVCENGHFVCDACHAESAVELITGICLRTDETDMIRLMEQIRKHPSIHLHGPEHHAMVPGIIMATYRNLGGDVSDEMIKTAISRGSGVAGGFCGFMGVCGAAIGVGIAFSIIFNANPMKAAERRNVQMITGEALRDIAALKAARCCQRDCYLAMAKAVELSEKYLPVTLKADYRIACSQMRINKECLGRECALHPLYGKAKIKSALAAKE